MKTIELIVRLIIKEKNKVLLCKPKKGGYYFLPGGHVEYGDSLEKTIYKEMYEELGFEEKQITGIYYISYLEQMYSEDGEDHHEINIIFNVSIPKDIIIKSKESHIDFEWIDIKDINNIKFLPEKIVNFI